MIPYPPLSPCGKPQNEGNGEGGFPHSEIAGSKFAHNSPTLIAACHVLHRLCMPRHPPIALTSRLRIHTTNDRTGTRCRRDAGRRIKRPSQLLREGATATQLDKDFSDGTRLPRPAGEPPVYEKPMPPRHRFLEPIHNVKDRGKSPYLQSNRRIRFLHSWKRRARPHPMRFAREFGGAYRDRTDDLKLAKLALSQLS